MAQLNRLVGSIMLVLLGTPLFSQSASTWKDPHRTSRDLSPSIKALSWKCSIGEGPAGPWYCWRGAGIRRTFLMISRRSSQTTSVFTVLSDADSVLPVTQTRRIRRTASATTWWQ
jgi:hypothetical protein